MAGGGLPTGGVRYFRKYLFDVPLAQTDFSAGVVRDVPRWVIPDNGLYRAEDVLLDNPGIVQGRGGSVNYGTAIAISGGVTPFTNMVATPNFTAGAKVFCISDKGDGSAYYISDITSGAASGTTSIGITPIENPPFGEDLLIITDSSGGVVPKTVNRSLTIASLDASAPKGTLSAVWNAFLVLANDKASNRNRIWFSAPGNFAGTWDTTNSWVDIDRPITALAVVNGNLLVFTRNGVTRILGSIPPNSTNATVPPLRNLSPQPLANIGCIDARSIVVVGDICFFANENGIYKTNGTSVESITTKGDNTGIGTLWTSQMDGLSPASGGMVCGGQWQDNWLIYAIHNDSSAANWLWLYYIPTGSFVQITNHDATMFASAISPKEKLYMATRSGGDSTHSMVLDLTNIFKPENGVTDFNSTKVTGLIETRSLIGTQIGLKRWGFGHVTYALPNASDVMTIKLATGLDGTLSFGNVDEGSAQPQAASVTKNRFTVNRDAQAISLRFQQTTANDVWNFYGFELESADFFVADGQ